MLGCYGADAWGREAALVTPRVDRLAAEGVRFERAYATAPWTIPSLASQLTGQWPWEHGALRLLQPLAPGRETLAERLRESGWRTAGVTTNFVTTAARSGFERGFDLWDESLARGHEGSTGAAAVARLLEQADELRRTSSGDPLFLFALLFEPHYRYEDGDRVAPLPLPELRARRETLTPEEIDELRDLYLGEVRAVDRAVGALVDGLVERGLWDRTTLVLASDHGEEIMDRGWIGHTVTLHDELVRVPLIVRLPEGRRDARRGATVEEPVSLVDFRATLLDLAGVESSPRSLAPAVLDGAEPAREWLYLHTDFEPPPGGADEKRARQFGVIEAATGRKWIVDHLPPDGGGPRGALYDLASDPGEVRPLEGPPPESFLRLRGLALEPLGPGQGGESLR